jgi:hypothetical protein
MNDQTRILLTLIVSVLSLGASQGSVVASAGANEMPNPFANLSGNFSDRGLDANQDGRLEFLTVDVGVYVQSSDEYSVMGSLYDKNGKEIVWAIDHDKLNYGYNKMQLDFDGRAIREHGINGPYQLRDLKLAIGNSYAGLGIVERIPVAYNTSSYDVSDFINPERNILRISGAGSGELQLVIRIDKILPVFSGKYSFDVVGINIPPISSEFNVTSRAGLAGYDYNMEGVHIPGRPNNFTISARNVKNINVGLKKLPVSSGINRTRTWVTAKIQADNNGVATADSDLLSPGNYHAKIFGDAAKNVSQVYLTMTMVKKMTMNGRFNLNINTTGFPAGNYSIAAKAINGSLKLDELAIEGLSIDE